MKWPRSKIAHIIVALTLGLVAGVGEYALSAMRSFNDFYFAPHKAYPYPYADAHTANLVLARNCGLAFGIVFFAAFALQELTTKRKPT